MARAVEHLRNDLPDYVLFEVKACDLAEAFAFFRELFSSAGLPQDSGAKVGVSSPEG
jgi:predicted enzyme related to lactoylglutathione lyase